MLCTPAFGLLALIGTDVLVVGMTLPSVGTVLADVGTVLMHGTCLFLVVGNWFIGRGEGWLLSRVFGLDPKRAAGWMIGANYTSAAIGLLAIPQIARFLQADVFADAPLYSAKAMLVTLAAMSFLLTVLIEWPFCVAAFRGQARGARRTLLASLTAQSASYLVLMPLYFWIADTRAATVLTPDRTLSFVSPELDARVYFVAAEDGDVYSIGVGGADRQKVATLSQPMTDARLYAAPGEGGAGWDLWVRSENRESDEGRRLGELYGVPGLADWIVEEQAFESRVWRDSSVADLRSANPGSWRVHTGVEMMTFLMARRGADEVVWRYETTYDRWWVRDMTVLPGDLVVAEVGSTLARGNHQIVVIGLNQRRIGVLARGSGPLVVMAETGGG